MPVPAARLITAQDLCALQFVGDPQVSPDGTHAAFVVTTTDADADEYRSRIWLVATDGAGKARPLTSGEKADTAPRWSPDGRQLAFLSTRGGKPQLYIIDLAGGEARQLTTREDGAGEAVWSPDGHQLAFAAIVPAEGAAEEERETAKSGEPLRIERLRYKSDGRGFIHGKASLERRRHLFVIDLPAAADGQTVEARQLTSGDWDDDQAVWSPDGVRLAFVSYREPDADRALRADIWTVAVEGFESPRKLTASDGSASGPAWSPDGATIAFFASAEAERPFATTRLWTIDASGRGSARSAAPDFDRDANSGPISDQTLPGGTARPIWSADGGDLLFLVGDGGNQSLYRVPARGGTPTAVIAGERAIVAVSAGVGVASPIVFCATDGTRPAELFATAADGSAERRLTDCNGPFLAGKTISPPERLRFRGGDEDEIDGWLIPPVEREAGLNYPLVLMIHGGPHGQYGNTFMHEFQFLAARGYGVLYLNPHGSSGRGAAFAKELTAAWGEKDLPDLLAGIDHVLARGEADPARLGVGGGSYGGFMTNWIIGHSERFKAAVTMRSIANLLNFWGTSDLFHLGTVPEFGNPWEEAERYLRLSPIMYAANFTTPTLILHQEEDHRCPIEQGEQLFTALQLRDIPTRFVRFPGESHGMSRNGKPAHRLQRLDEIVNWYDRFLRADQAKTGTK